MYIQHARTLRPAQVHRPDKDHPQTHYHHYRVTVNGRTELFSSLRAATAHANAQADLLMTDWYELSDRLADLYNVVRCMAIQLPPPMLRQVKASMRMAEDVLDRMPERTGINGNHFMYQDARLCADCMRQVIDTLRETPPLRAMRQHRGMLQVIEASLTRIAEHIDRP